MKRILLLVAFAAQTITSYSQLLDYNDLGILFSKDDNYGTARFKAMSGAFGALGGDISATDINPAGGVVSKQSSISASLSSNNLNYNSNYYGNSSNRQNNDFNISQIGAVLVFDSAFSKSWSRFALSFNYRKKKDFFNNYTAEGNSNRLFYDEHFSDPTTSGQFDASVDQFISNRENGKSSVFNLGFSAVHLKKLFVGGSIKFHNLQFQQISLFNEVNDDIDGNLLDTETYEETYLEGNGVSLNLGFIYKFNKNMRFGLSYETPTWYQEILEDYYDEFIMYEISELNIEEYFENDDNPNLFSHKYKTPSRITASAAYIFGSRGLISADFTHKDYKNTTFYGDSFNETNESFKNDYRNTYSIKVGTEWRFDNLSLRGGLSYEKDPNLIAGGNTNLDNIKGYSLGLGYNFGNTKFDLAYTNTENTIYKTVYTTGDLTLDRKNSQITGTITFNL